MDGLDLGKLVVDNVHGDIRPTKEEWRVIDTASFQRLRRLKQLQMGYLVYPNAVHTRFAHSLGVLHVMSRALERVKSNLKLTNEQIVELRLAALLHDVGHYPYSHLLEKVHKVILAEERVGAAKSKISLGGKNAKYPSHESVGRWVLENQQDIAKALGGGESAQSRLRRIGEIFTGEAMDQGMTNLIHSSLDMDRMDYLVRDSRSAGVPYGEVDINYLLNNIKASSSGELGISHKALAAAEHLLLARSFLFRAVYYHKTTFGLEEAARQLLRRLRDRHDSGDGPTYDVPRDGDEIKEIVTSTRLIGFADSFLDQIFAKVNDNKEEEDPVVKALAWSIVSRQPPRLLIEESEFVESSEANHLERGFLGNCKELPGIANDMEVPLGRFLICTLSPVGFEPYGFRMTAEQVAQEQEEGKMSEMIRIFPNKDAEAPVSVVSINHSILNKIGGHVHRIFRVYFVPYLGDKESLIPELKHRIREVWQVT